MTAACKTSNIIKRRFQQPQVCHQIKVDGVELWIGCARGKVGESKDLGIFVFCVSDARSVVDDYASARDATPDFLEGEMRRIAKMTASEWEDFLRVREGYNPFADRRNRQRAKAGDKKLRKKYSMVDFRSDRHLPASGKRALVHEYERFLVARIYGGKGHAVSRMALPLARVLTSLSNSREFDSPRSLYQIHFREDDALKAHLKAVSTGRDLHGNPWRVPHDKAGDVTAALVAIAKAYVRR